MNPSRERLLWFFGTALIAAGCLGVVVVPAIGHYNEALAQLNDARASRSIAERQGAAFAAIESSRAKISKESDLLNSYFITKDSAVTYLAGLDALAAANGLPPPDVSLPTDIGTGPRLVAITLSVTGPLPGVLSFAEQLTARQPIASIDSLEITNTPSVTLTIHAQTAWQ